LLCHDAALLLLTRRFLGAGRLLLAQDSLPMSFQNGLD
jgi:hypothetical protein